ncbi:MAG: hypothetical protein K8S54_13425 [Spirochaetia bacterium]|nr:hypothetical protein [Spirochaetia bacterium]
MASLSLRRLILAGAFAFAATPAFAFGTYAEGQTTMTIKRFESSGVIIESWEGSAEVATYNKSEKCAELENQCYTVVRNLILFSVRPDTDQGKLAAELQKNLNKEILVSYKIHRIESLSLSTDFEVTGIIEAQDRLGPDLPAKKVVRKTGGKRNFSVLGKILQLEYSGTVVGTYEGIYLDSQSGKVHPFSITSQEMANHAMKVMALRREYNIGVSQAYATGFRKSDCDIFEINMNEPAGTLDAPKEAETN